MNWEMNERVSLSSRSSTGLAIRPDSRKGIEFSETCRRNVESRSKIGSECSERKVKSSSSAGPTLELMNVSGFAGSNVARKHRGVCSIDMTDENVLRSDSKYEIGILSRGSSTLREQRRQGDTLMSRDNGDGTKRWTKDSISKRLELIHELNQKILANYERFQQKSRRTKDVKEQIVKSRVKDKTDAEEHVYTEIKKRHKTGCRTSDRKTRDILKHDTWGKESSEQDASRRTDKLVFLNDYHEKIDTKDQTEKTDKSDRKIVRENTNFSMAAKENFSYQVDEKTQLSKYPKSKDKKGRLSEENSIFYANENISSKEMESVATGDCLESSKLYPQSCNSHNNEMKNDSLMEKTENSVSRNRSRDRSEISSQKDVVESRAESGDAATDEKILECRILEKLDKTIDRFDSERTRLSSGDSNEEENSFSTDSIQSQSPKSEEKCTKDVASLLQDTFNSSWDSGVGVADLGNGSGWVRIHTGIESSLVYLTLDTTAKDVCRDMLLGDDLSLFVQVNASFTRG